MRAAAQPAAAVAQAEQRVELLHQLDGGRAAAQRPDRHPVARRRLARDLEDGKRDVQPAAQVHERVGAPQAHVARRPQRLDQPVLEHERAELGARLAVVDDRGVRRPRRAPRPVEVRPRPRAQGHRLADVQRPAVGVAEHVHARAPPAGRQIEAGRHRAAGQASGRWAPRARRRRRGASSATASPTVAAFAHSRPNSAQNTRAQVSASASARWLISTSMPSDAGQRREPALALQRREAARERDRAQHRRIGPLQAGAVERLAQHAPVERRGVGDEHAPG